MWQSYIFNFLTHLVFDFVVVVLNTFFDFYLSKEKIIYEADTLKSLETEEENKESSSSSSEEEEEAEEDEVSESDTEKEAGNIFI